MAQFGTDATQLSAPQGAGTQVLPAVKSEVSIIPKLIETGINIFAKGLDNTAKEEALKRKNAVIGGYVKSETNINNAVSSGQMSPVTLNRFHQF